MMEKILPSAITLLGLFIMLAIFFPVYEPYLHTQRHVDGRTNWETFLSKALASENKGNQALANKMYHRIIESALPGQRGLSLFVDGEDSLLLKARAYIAVGTIRSYNKNDIQALVAYRIAVRLVPKDARSQCYYGNGLAKIGLTDRAMVAYNKAIAMGDRDAKVYARISIQALTRN